MTHTDKHLSNIYAIQAHLQKDEIVDKVSRMVKSMSHETKNGMMEVPAHFIKEIDKMLSNLDYIQNRKPYNP